MDNSALCCGGAPSCPLTHGPDYYYGYDRVVPFSTVKWFPFQLSKCRLRSQCGSLFDRQMVPFSVDKYRQRSSAFVTCNRASPILTAVASLPHPTTARRNPIKTFFSFLTQSGYLRRNVAAELIPPLSPHKDRYFLSEDEYQRVLANVHTGRDRAVLELFLQTSLRLSELVGTCYQTHVWIGARVRVDRGRFVTRDAGQVDPAIAYLLASCFWVGPPTTRRRATW